MTHLHRLELHNAWQLKVHRRELSADGAALARERLQADLEAGVWVAPDHDLAEVFRAAVRLAREHSADLGTRALDVLHVAMALVLEERDFVTGDARQAKLAEALGFRVTRL